MASVDFKKLSGGTSVAGMLLHCATDTRLTHEHSNKQINKARTHLNWETGTYRESMDRYHARIKELDDTTNKNHRKDRVTCFGLYIPAPAGLSQEEQVQFLHRAAEHLKTRFSSKNVIYAGIHVDEIDEYLDHGETKVSRPHLHCYVVPEIDGTLNGKRFSSRASMQALNKQLHKICQREFGVDFMTGAEVRKRSVEELKVSSAREVMELKDKTLKEASEASQRLQKTRKEQSCMDKTLASKKAQDERLDASIAEKRKRVRQLCTDRDEIKRYLTLGSREEREMMSFMSQYTINGKTLSDVFVDQVMDRIQREHPEPPQEEDDDPWGDGLER